MEEQHEGHDHHLPVFTPGAVYHSSIGPFFHNGERRNHIHTGVFSFYFNTFSFTCYGQHLLYRGLNKPSLCSLKNEV